MKAKSKEETGTRDLELSFCDPKAGCEPTSSRLGPTMSILDTEAHGDNWPVSILHVGRTVFGL